MSATTTGIDPMALLAGMAQQTEKKKGKCADNPLWLKVKWRDGADGHTLVA